MYRIVEKQELAPAIKMMVVEAPNVAHKAQPGQFVIVRIDEPGERIPLTIADHDAAAGTITLVVQEVGKTTAQMGALEVGDALATVAGPLGHPTEIAPYGTVACVGGGVGIAPIFPIARALRAAGNRVVSIIGARSHNLLFWEERMRSVSDELIVCTDDGSYGRPGLVTEPLRELLEQRPGEIAHIWAIGPAVMMKFVSRTTEPFGVPTTVSLNTVMIDGTGMCGGCRVVVHGGAKFVCVDGPEFDGWQVDWDLLLSRLQYYRPQEQEAMERWQEHCRAEEVTA
ncbi:MAG: sulfide/dihydroorotate dehydrogenase-like FAD/NAD-binding protein [Acidimicrobiia bacterium]|nr:sulfide/dihydroorotate dehydrogenase-like FAD/NAD-binding protein [Acidimicrobiia bacterium]